MREETNKEKIPERFYGFDLGDAECAIASLPEEAELPSILSVKGTGSFITAYARREDGSVLIGEEACYEPKVTERKIRFKSRFLMEKSAAKDVRTFAMGVLSELSSSGGLFANEETSFYIGCPAGWSPNDRELYREIFEAAGYPPVKIVSESRAALISACRSKHLQVGYDILTKPMLVIDMGSSTTDFAYISGGKEQTLKTAGEVFLGGGIMDQILAEEAVGDSTFSGHLKKIMEESEPWRSYLEFAARRLKEKYYADEEYWKEHKCTQSVTVRYDLPLRVTLRMDAEMARKLEEKKCDRLSGKSFKEVFLESLLAVREHIGEAQPELLFLTGGVSKLPSVRTWCMEIFPEAVIILGREPEYAVAKGLSLSGRIDREVRLFREDIAALVESDAVEQIVRQHIDDLYKSSVDALVEPLLSHAALPVFDRWREGAIRRLSGCDAEIEKGISEFLQSEEARTILSGTITRWLGPVTGEIEEITIPVCVAHNVPYTALSLSSYLSLSDVKIGLDARSVFAVGELTWLINTIVSVLVGLLCGGSGIALIAQGLPGIITGAAASLLLLLIGKEKMEGALLKTDLPGAIRKLVPKNYFETRLDRMAGEVKASFLKNLEKEKDDEITGDMVEEISGQLERCLTKMADVVELPLV